MTPEVESGNAWYGMYDKQRKFSGIDVSTGNVNEDKLQSSMIWGSQYDAMLNWILTGIDKEKVMKSNQGNHNISLAGCGTYGGGSDIINNIYDLEGNVCEWTLTLIYQYAFVSRGGHRYEANTPSYRHYGDDPDYHTLNYFGSRLSLYIK